MSGRAVHSTEDRTSTGIGMQNVTAGLNVFLCVRKLFKYQVKAPGKEQN